MPTIVVNDQRAQRRPWQRRIDDDGQSVARQVKCLKMTIETVQTGWFDINEEIIIEVQLLKPTER